LANRGPKLDFREGPGLKGGRGMQRDWRPSGRWARAESAHRRKLPKFSVRARGKKEEDSWGQAVSKG